MKTTCLINNYNYAEFLGEAIDSALAQTVPFDEIIVVDDGSTDGSRELLYRNYARHPAVQLLVKCNQGQLSCFNDGFARSSGEVVYFLDADDSYEPSYLERSLDIYERDAAIDFVACGGRYVGQQNELQLEFTVDRDLGYSVLRAACLRDWIGAATSCLSMRRRVLEKVLPLPFLDDWRTRADDCLVFGASLAGARKYYLAQPLARLRIHNSNLFRRRQHSESAVYRRRLAINALFEYLERKHCYNIPRLAEFSHREFCTITAPNWHEFLQYVQISMSAALSPWRRAACLGEMLRHLLRNGLSSKASASRSAVEQDAATVSANPRPPDLRHAA
jgi:glycosyltransferase involved in cell wall biosynthesis